MTPRQCYRATGTNSTRSVVVTLFAVWLVGVALGLLGLGGVLVADMVLDTWKSTRYVMIAGGCLVAWGLVGLAAWTAALGLHVAGLM
jgi:hypothetical protein